MIKYKLINTTDQSISEQAVKNGVNRAEAKLKDNEHRFISIELVTPQGSRELNMRLRGKDEPTDVISISTQETKAGEQVIEAAPDGSLNFSLKNKGERNQWPILGQLVICYAVVTQNAELAGQPVERELEWVVEHGILHLMGYHHEHDD